MKIDQLPPPFDAASGVRPTDAPHPASPAVVTANVINTANHFFIFISAASFVIPA